MSVETREFWDGVHRRRHRSGPGRPHPYLVDHGRSAAPGTVATITAPEPRITCDEQ